MTAKRFNFSIATTTHTMLIEFSAEAPTLAAAFAAGAAAVGSEWTAGDGPLRLIRFRVENALTREFTAFIGQGVTIAAAFADGLKGSRDTFRPKNDGRTRPQIGLSVLLPVPWGARRIVTRSVENFESDAGFNPEKEPQEMLPPACAIPAYLNIPKRRTFIEEMTELPLPPAPGPGDEELALE